MTSLSSHPRLWKRISSTYCVPLYALVFIQNVNCSCDTFSFGPVFFSPSFPPNRIPHRCTLPVLHKSPTLKKFVLALLNELSKLCISNDMMISKLNINTLEPPHILCGPQQPLTSMVEVSYAWLPLFVPSHVYGQQHWCTLPARCLSSPIFLAEIWCVGKGDFCVPQGPSRSGQ